MADTTTGTTHRPFCCTGLLNIFSLKAEGGKSVLLLRALGQKILVSILGTRDEMCLFLFRVWCAHREKSRVLWDKRWLFLFWAHVTRCACFYFGCGAHTARNRECSGTKDGSFYFGHT